MTPHRDNEAPVECIRDYKKNAEALLKVLSDLRIVTESVQESPKKDRKRTGPRG